MTEEEKIIQAVLAGKTDAYRWIIERYQGPVLQMIANLVGDRFAAEDIAQDVFVIVYEKLSTHDPARSRFSTWLFVIARNQSINYLRKRRCIPVPGSSPVASSDDPSERICREEFMEQLDRVLNGLPSYQKRAFTLAEFENLPYDQIAQIECASIGTIRSRIHRAKKKIKKALEALDGA
ncbi:MAG: sigma-70 family RNA polymerase sigma factor [Phycisphaerae bacterium]|nr:sigma-70 family RNA polymerase sigma factor [Phycisphaerae bacterium]